MGRVVYDVWLCALGAVQKLGQRGGSDSVHLLPSCTLVPTSARDTGCVLRGMQEDSHRGLHLGLGEEHEAAEVVAARVAVGDARTILHGFSHFCWVTE